MIDSYGLEADGASFLVSFTLEADLASRFVVSYGLEAGLAWRLVVDDMAATTDRVIRLKFGYSNHLLHS